MFGVGGPPGPFSIPHYTAAKHGMSTLHELNTQAILTATAVVGVTKMVYYFISDAAGFANVLLGCQGVCPRRDTYQCYLSRIC